MMNSKLSKVCLSVSAALVLISPRCGVAGEAAPDYKADFKSDYKVPTGGGGTIRDTPFRAAVTLREGYDDNVFTTESNEQDSWFTKLYAEVSADFSRPRTQFTIGVAGGVTYYSDLDGDNWDYNASFTLSLVHRASSRLTLSARIYLTYQEEPDFSLLIGSERRGGQYFFGNSQFSVSYQWSPKFSTVSSYSLVGVFYDDDFASQTSDRLEHYFSQEFRFLIQPTTTLVAEYRFGYFDYIDNDPQDGTAHYFLLGLDQTFSPRLSLSVRGGVEVRETDAGGKATAPYGEGTLSYRYGRYSTVSWVNRYGFEQNSLGGGDERKTFRSGLTVRHGFTRKLSLLLAGFYHHNDYNGNLDFSEDLFDTSVGLNFAINRNFAVEAGYSYTALSSDVTFREYDRSRYHIGGTFSF